MISGRRIVWGFNCLLLLAAVLIYRPVRTWIDQVIVARCLHPNLKVGEIKLLRSGNLRGHTVVQASHFDWGATDDDRCFGITAENAWFVVEDEPLIEKKIAIPQAVLKNSRLYMQTLPGADQLASLSTTGVIARADVDSIWQKHLDSRQGPWNWNDLKKFLDHKLQIDQFISECTSRIDDWIVKGSELADAAQGLTNSQMEWSNPLRDISDIQQRLVQIDELSQKQIGLRTELNSVEKFIEEKLQFIGKTFDQQRSAINGNLTNENAVPIADGQAIALDVDIKSLATELLVRCGRQSHAQFGVFMEFADRFCRAAVRDSRLIQDRDFRQSGQELFALQQLTASGMFRCDPVMSPFRMSSNGQKLQAQGSETRSLAKFKYQFEAAPVCLLVSVNNLEENPASNKLHMELMPLSSVRAFEGRDEKLPLDQRSPQWEVFTDGATVSGYLDIDSRLIPVLLSEHPAMIQSAMAALEGESIDPKDVIRLNCNGTWKSLEWTLADSQLPFWFLKEVMLEQQRQMQQRTQQQIACIEQYFHGEIQRIDSMVQKAINAAQLHSQQHSEKILAARASLTSDLSKVQQVEFARQPKEDVKR